MDGNYSCRGCWQPWSGAVRGNGRRRQPSRRAATRAGTRPCAGPVTRLETFPGVPEVFVTQLRLGHGYRDVDAVGPIWAWMYRSGRLEGLVVCSAGRVPLPWAAAHVQLWRGVRQSLHIRVVDDPH